MSLLDDLLRLVALADVVGSGRRRQGQKQFAPPSLHSLSLELAVQFLEQSKEGHVLFNDTLNTFYLRLYGVRHKVKDHPESERGNPLPLLMGHTFRLAAGVHIYASSHRQDNTYDGLCYTSRGALAGTRNSSMGPP